MGDFLGQALLVLLAFATLCSCETFYIVPVNSTERCGAEPCLTLDQLASEIWNQHFGDLTLYFIPGQHFLHQHLILNSSGNVKIIGYSSDSNIWLKGNKLTILNVQNVVIERLLFASSNNFTQKAGNVAITLIGSLLLNNCTFWGAVVMISSDSIEVTECTFDNKPAFHDYHFDEDHVLTNYSNTVFFHVSGLLNLSDSIFAFNFGLAGGGIRIDALDSGLIHIVNCEFTDNQAEYDGGAVYIRNAVRVSITDSEFAFNYAGVDGGAIYIENTTRIIVANNTFISNDAIDSGGAIFIKGTARLSRITITYTTFTGNTACYGGAIFMYNRYVEISNCTFSKNYACYWRSGSAIAIHSLLEPFSGTVIIRSTTFTSNSGAGAVLVLNSRVSIEDISIIDNYADLFGLRILHSTLTIRQFNFNQNRGIIGSMEVCSNVDGNINAIQSQIYINSTERIVISNNSASLGGGILLRESGLTIRSPVIISNNTAQTFGGGIHAYDSTIEFTSEIRNGESFVIDNFAGKDGGGVYAVASTVKLSRSYVTIGSNTARLRGGGLYLEGDSKVYLLKRKHETGEIEVRLKVTNNSAKYGGGVFVADNSTAGVLQCQGQDQSQRYTDCFFQAIQLYQIIDGKPDNVINTFVINNTAEQGSALLRRSA